MRKFCHWVFYFAAALLMVGCDTFPQPMRAETAPRMTTSTTQRQPDRARVELLNLREDMQLLDRKVREMGLEIEELNRQNQRLSAELEEQRRQAGALANFVGRAELEGVVNDLEGMARAADSDQRREILRQVTAQIEELGRQTQAAIDALARNVSSRPVATASSPTFSDNFPTEGISYTVQRGDTLSSIAARHNSTVKFIQNANRIENPAALQIGQTLFIPQK